MKVLPRRKKTAPRIVTIKNDEQLKFDLFKEVAPVPSLSHKRKLFNNSNFH